MTVDYLLGILTLPALAVVVFAASLCREAAGHVWAMALQYGPWRPVWPETARRAGQLLARGESRGFNGRQWGTVRTMRKHARSAVRFGRWPLILWPPFLYVALVSWGAWAETMIRLFCALSRPAIWLRLFFARRVASRAEATARTLRTEIDTRTARIYDLPLGSDARGLTAASVYLDLPLVWDAEAAAKKARTVVEALTTKLAVGLP